MGLSRKQKFAIKQNAIAVANRKRIETENELRYMRNFDPNSHSYQMRELEQKRWNKSLECPKRTGSKRFERAEIMLDENTGDILINGKFVPTTQICESHFGNARMIKSVDESGLNVSKFEPQSYSNRTKNSHLNSAYRVRGDVKISGGHVTNEMTIASKHDAVEMEMGIL